MNRSMTEQENSVDASVCISWTYEKYVLLMLIIKEYMSQAGNVLFENKQHVTENLPCIVLSTSLNTRNTYVLAKSC